MTVDVTVPPGSVRAASRRSPAFGLSWRILALVVTAVMTAEVLIFLPSIARFREVYLEQLIESGTLAAIALDATPDNMVTEEVKRSLLNHARVDAVVLVEPNKPKRALMNIEPRADMPSFNLMSRGALGLIWDALSSMTEDGSRYIRVGGSSMRLPSAMVWIVVDELPMRIAMYGYAGRILALSIIIALFTAVLLYLGLRWVVIRPLQGLSSDMTAFRRAPEETGITRAPTRRNDEIGVVDREFQNLQRELRASLRQKSRLAEVGAATNKINHDLRNMLSTARLLSDRMARSGDERTRVLAPTILNTIDRAARLASDAIEYVRDQPAPRLATIDLADLVDEAGIALQEQGEDSAPNVVRSWHNEIGEGRSARADRDVLYRVFVNLGRNAFEAGATNVTVRSRVGAGYLLIDVADDGPGVPQAVAAQLFRPFTTGGRAGGTGLGLVIARDLIRAHGGDIALTETGTGGTTFRFTLPLGDAGLYRRPRRSVFGLEPCDELANASCVNSEIGLADTALGTDVHPAARAVGPDTHDDVVAKAKPVAGLDGFQSSFRRRACDDVPLQGRGDTVDPLERLGRWNGQDNGHDVGIGSALEHGGGDTGIAGWIGCTPSQLQQRDHGRRIGDIRRNVVDHRQPLGPEEPTHRHPGPGNADDDGEERRHESAPSVARARRQDGRQPQSHGGNGCIEAVAENGDGPLDIQPDIAMQRTGGGYGQRCRARGDEGQACKTMADLVGRSNEHAVSAVIVS